eukprot:4076228-Alexandrium_andersonii.AAC.1
MAAFAGLLAPLLPAWILGHCKTDCAIFPKHVLTQYYNSETLSGAACYLTHHPSLLMVMRVMVIVMVMLVVGALANVRPMTMRALVMISRLCS